MDYELWIMKEDNSPLSRLLQKPCIHLFIYSFAFQPMPALFRGVMASSAQLRQVPGTRNEQHSTN
jgi:hypothetical protein